LAGGQHLLRGGRGSGLLPQLRATVLPKRQAQQSAADRAVHAALRGETRLRRRLLRRARLAGAGLRGAVDLEDHLPTY